MTNRRLTTELSNYNFRAADTRLCNNLLPSRRLIRWGAILLLVTGYGLTIFLNRRFNTDAYNAFAFLSLVGFVVLLLGSAFLLRKRIYGAKRDAAIRNGETTISLDDEGMHVEHSGTRQVNFWSHVTDVIDGPDGLLVLVNLWEYHPIPSHSFPHGVDKNQLKAQIKEWIAKART